MFYDGDQEDSNGEEAYLIEDETTWEINSVYFPAFMRPVNHTSWCDSSIIDILLHSSKRNILSLSND
ncbi:hypothetical protein HXA34_02265 [Salipaludibacillus agaradhaerens]|uniref:hypothetical protein n=1 Tax=Salipaludibacillus agaradhaerens TaxID=76935 RepID=UPI002151D6EA|nr:hypothetical protein [Salipaludibacillus agaradhaerens]MCR6105109.1 hypothetical protein [Salipaludibacillus agaradhaerens]MCR6117154.1 hypothetical protein [Salipaludibacillus agaradhaerens]